MGSSDFQLCVSCRCLHVCRCVPLPSCTIHHRMQIISLDAAPTLSALALRWHRWSPVTTGSLRGASWRRPPPARRLTWQSGLVRVPISWSSPPRAWMCSRCVGAGMLSIREEVACKCCVVVVVAVAAAVAAAAAAGAGAAAAAGAVDACRGCSYSLVCPACFGMAFGGGCFVPGV